MQYIHVQIITATPLTFTKGNEVIAQNLIIKTTMMWIPIRRNQILFIGIRPSGNTSNRAHRSKQER